MLWLRRNKCTPPSRTMALLMPKLDAIGDTGKWLMEPLSTLLVSLILVAGSAWWILRK